MKKASSIYFSLFIILTGAFFVPGSMGCANMIPPTGGPRDSLPPVLITASPKDSATNFTGNRIILNFDEFVEVQNTFENVLYSPTPNNIPVINFRFRTVNIRIKDTLESNTTYSINFGDAIKDINEGNILKNFTYVFSTGSTIDSNTVSGKVVMAETGKIDSTLLVVLHRKLDDSAVVKEKPRYVAKLDGLGNFQFRNLPEGTFALYAIPNEFSRRYDDTTKPFAFTDKPISTINNSPVTLFAYTLPKRDTSGATPKGPLINIGGRNEKDKDKDKDKLLRFQTNLDGGRQDLLDSLVLTFNRPIKTFDSSKIILVNKTLNPVNNYSIVADTNKTSFTVRHSWPANTDFNLIIDKTAFTDTAGVTLLRNDTLEFSTKRNEDYGSVKLTFRNIDFAKNPVLQIVSSEKIIESVPLTQRVWSRRLFPPGEYELRILYDSNKNGVWDPGKFFGTHVQPETVITLNKKLSVRANWDNDNDISL